MSEHIFEESLKRYVEELKDEKEMTEKQRQILRASVKLFAEKGFHASSTADIAKEAGVAEGTIFRHYKSKKDLLLAVVAPALVKFAAPFILKDVRKILTEQEQKPYAEVMTMLLHNRLQLIGANLKQFRILLQEAFFHEELQEAILKSVIKEVTTLAGQFAEERIARGELRPLPPDVIVRTFASMMFGLVLFKYVLPEKYDQYSDEEQIAMTVDILMNGIANKPAQP
ncbi:TetR/AcrR family transcriptional regulator [Brevibacillus sp. SYP-B805]|uniref:TetR/AcrR family transcriptional regulator n=1 Tax=Brevibacillus sp. SYP-B805 TaxID=1578199 RepID=UPI0013EC7B79|nr:TetR/AcrR family transcriptional regulator [Brevibacillus sp. SYP-B805]NGQ95173.1 TetR/AcrR family transcriptional regulator [Brevibacillus sp. SYP-B805]